MAGPVTCSPSNEARIVRAADSYSAAADALSSCLDEPSRDMGHEKKFLRMGLLIEIVTDRYHR